MRALSLTMHRPRSQSETSWVSERVATSMSRSGFCTRWRYPGRGHQTDSWGNVGEIVEAVGTGGKQQSRKRTARDIEQRVHRSAAAILQAATILPSGMIRSRTGALRSPASPYHATAAPSTANSRSTSASVVHKWGVTRMAAARTET